LGTNNQRGTVLSISVWRMKYKIRLAVLFVEQLRTKEKGEGHFCKKGCPTPFFFIPARHPTFWSLSHLCAPSSSPFSPPLQMPPKLSKTLDFRLNLAKKSPCFTSPSLKKPLVMKSGWKFEGFRRVVG